MRLGTCGRYPHCLPSIRSIADRNWTAGSDGSGLYWKSAIPAKLHRSEASRPRKHHATRTSEAYSFRNNTNGLRNKLSLRCRQLFTIPAFSFSLRDFQQDVIRMDHSPRHRVSKWVFGSPAKLEESRVLRRGALERTLDCCLTAEMLDGTTFRTVLYETGKLDSIILARR